MTDIVDSHHHIWRQKDMPWLSGPIQPRIFGPYAPLQRDYLMDEFQRDLAGTGVVKSVHVQANWPADKFEDEVAWVSQVADETGWPHGIVGYADVTVDDVRPQLDRLTKYKLMRGVRMQLHWHENTTYRFAARPDLPADPKVQRNVARLADYGWTFDLQVFAPQMADAARLAAACPRVTLVLQHAGMPEDLSDKGWGEWRAGMRLLAAQPNIVSKTSALGTFIHRNDPAHIAAITRETVALFGADRTMFGSNFPIEKLWATYPELIAAHRAAAAQLPVADQCKVLHDTAMRVYRLA
jgi:predicted TIM-barrel fold metal-dependent hydrolase